MIRAAIPALWGVAYLPGRCSLVPCMVAHFINDPTAAPWVAWFMFAERLG